MFQPTPNGNDAQVFPTSPGGAYKLNSTVGSLALVSTLGPNLVNEFRAGVQRASLAFESPWTANSAGTGVLPSINGIPYTETIDRPSEQQLLDMLAQAGLR
jgi:hypothetical protein